MAQSKFTLYEYVKLEDGLALLQSYLLFKRKNQAQPLHRRWEGRGTSRGSLLPLPRQEVDSRRHRRTGSTTPAECSSRRRRAQAPEGNGRRAGLGHGTDMQQDFAGNGSGAIFLEP